MDFHKMAGDQFQAAAEQVPDHDQDKMLDLVTLLNEEERAELISFITQHTYVNFVGNTVNGAFSEGVDPQQLIDLCAQVIPPVVLAIGRSLYEGKAPKEGDQHLAALEAEISLSTMIEEDKDLSVIWPKEIAHDVVKIFDDPVKAFYAGVMCGRSNG
jgi:hypothetical protein